MIATAQIASLSSIRVLVLDQADTCETTYAMHLRLRLARSLARLIEDLRQGVITLNERSFGIWGRIVLTDEVPANDPQTEGLAPVLEDLRDLGVEVVTATAPGGSKNDEDDFRLAA